MATGILTFSKKIEILLRFCATYLLLALFFFMDMISINVPYFEEIRPSFTLMSIFYWSIYRPSILPSWVAFLGGVFFDLISGLPVGLHALLFLLVQRVVTDQRKIFMGQSFFAVFVGYCVVMVGVYGLQWSLFCLVNGLIVPFEPVVGAVILGVVFFPIALLLMNMAHKILPYSSAGMK